MELVVYGTDRDAAVKRSVRFNHDVKDFLECEELRDLLEEIDEAAQAAGMKLYASPPESEASNLQGAVACLAEVLSDSQAASLKRLDNDPAVMELIQEHMALAARMVAETIRLVDGGDQESALAGLLKESSVGKLAVAATGASRSSTTFCLPGRTPTTPRHGPRS